MKLLLPGECRDSEEVACIVCYSLVERYFQQRIRGEEVWPTSRYSSYVRITATITIGFEGAAWTDPVSKSDEGCPAMRQIQMANV